MFEIENEYGSEAVECLIKNRLKSIIGTFRSGSQEYTHYDFSCPEEQFSVKFILTGK